MINLFTVCSFCKEDISFIENYDKAIADNTQTWDCHHRLEIQGKKILSVKELKEQKLYYKRPACELIFLTHSEHSILHNENRKSDWNKKISESEKGKVDKGHQVIAFQEPTSSNNYTWYRKYADGWVEQGGILQAQTISAGYSASQTLTLPITMADTNFTVTFGDVSGNQAYQSATISRTTTGGTVYQMNRAASGSASIQFSYVVSGIAA